MQKGNLLHQDVKAEIIKLKVQTTQSNGMNVDELARVKQLQEEVQRMQRTNMSNLKRNLKDFTPQINQFFKEKETLIFQRIQ